MIALLSAWAARAPSLNKKPNIGDRLVEDAVVWHLRTTGGLTEEEFPVFCARMPLDRAALATVNRSRALVLCGSNLFHQTFWPGYVKLTKRLSSIRVPIVSIGVGWGGEKARHGYAFRPSAREALRRIAGNFPVLSVRDEITRELLEEQVNATRGRVRVTGCPVLFRHNRGVFDAAGLSGAGESFAPRRILFSTNERLHLDEHVTLFHRVHELFPHAEYTVALNQDSAAFLERVNGESVRVFRSDDGDAYYREFQAHDFQIGFRLHNHMAFLSLSKPSITVEADGRTRGFAETFDLENLPIDEIPRLDGPRIRSLLRRTADRLPEVGARRWMGLEDLIRRLASLPSPRPGPLLGRLFGH